VSRGTGDAAGEAGRSSGAAQRGSPDAAGGNVPDHIAVSPIRLSRSRNAVEGFRSLPLTTCVEDHRAAIASHVNVSH